MKIRDEDEFTVEDISTETVFYNNRINLESMKDLIESFLEEI